MATLAPTEMAILFHWSLKRSTLSGTLIVISLNLLN